MDLHTFFQFKMSNVIRVSLHVLTHCIYDGVIARIGRVEHMDKFAHALPLRRIQGEKDSCRASIDSVGVT
jgi:hypothetical protein